MIKTTYTCDKCGKVVKWYYHLKAIDSIVFDETINVELCNKCHKQLKKWLKSQEVK